MLNAIHVASLTFSGILSHWCIHKSLSGILPHRCLHSQPFGRISPHQCIHNHSGTLPHWCIQNCLVEFFLTDVYTITQWTTMNLYVTAIYLKHHWTTVDLYVTTTHHKHCWTIGFLQAIILSVCLCNCSGAYIYCKNQYLEKVYWGFPL